MKHIIIIEETPSTEPGGAPTCVEILSMRREDIDLPAITRLLVTEPKPPRARRSDAGKPRKNDTLSLS